MSGRRKAREESLKLLFRLHNGPETLDEVMEWFSRLAGVQEDVREFTEFLVRGVCAGCAELDGVLAPLCRGWDYSRIASTDKEALRLGAFEIRECPETPVAVIINEAVDLAKRFGTEDSGRFVNGVLTSVARQLQTTGKRS